jgi:hypothetical protein
VHIGKSGNYTQVCGQLQALAVLPRLDVLEKRKSVVSDFRCDVDEISALLGYYEALNGNHLPTFRDNVSVPSLTLEDGTDTLSQIVDKGLPFDAA